MIEINGLTLRLNNKLILDDINLVIPSDRKTVIIGKSGCGKTMLMKTLVGLYHPQAGSIRIDGEETLCPEASERPLLLNKIAMLFQYAALLDSFTVF